MSFTPISKIIKAYDRKKELQAKREESNQSSQIKKPFLSSRAFKLFSDGKKLTEVVIELDIPPEKVEKLWSQFLKSERMEECYDFFQMCQYNIPTSQMAEGFFKKYAPDGFKVQSAGTKPVFQINPIVVEAMKEVGIDISKQKSKELTDEMIRDSDNVVNMGCMDKNFCPTIWIPKVIEWNLEDPKGKSIEKVREIRDEIEKRVKEIVAEITNTAQR